MSFLEKNRTKLGTTYVLVMDRVPETRVLGYGSPIEKWVLGKLNNVFLLFYQTFGNFLQLA